MLIAIMTITSAIVRKAIGLVAPVAPRVTRSPSELQATPFSTRSQELPFLEPQTLAAIVQTPAARASRPNCEDASLVWMNARRFGDPSRLPIRKIKMPNSASRTPHSASSHQLLTND